MQELELAKKALDDVIDEKTPFNEALRKIFQADPAIREYRPIAAALLGCELRHHLLFMEVLSRIEGLSEDDRRYASLALADLYFVRRIPKDAIVSALSETLGAEKTSALQELIEKSDRQDSLIPAEYQANRSSNKYLSLRFNTPEWVLKIWQHYGYGNTYKVLKKNIRPGLETVRARLSKGTPEEILGGNPDFSPSAVPGIYVYNGKTPLRKVQAYHDGLLFSERMATKAILDEYKVEHPSELLAYVGKGHSSILKELLETYGHSIGMNLAVPDAELFGDVAAMIRKDALKNVNFFAAEPDSLASAVSRPVELAIAAPESSHFDMVREEPDYLLHFDREGMDAILAQEKAVLEGVSNYVAAGGTLLYMVHTISKKEGHRTIDAFLSSHPEYTLLKEEQRFPFDALDTAVYFAALRKTGEEKALGVPFDPAALSVPSESVATQAASAERP